MPHNVICVGCPSVICRHITTDPIPESGSIRKVFPCLIVFFTGATPNPPGHISVVAVHPIRSRRHYKQPNDKNLYQLHTKTHYIIFSGSRNNVVSFGESLSAAAPFVWRYYTASLLYRFSLSPISVNRNWSFLMSVLGT